MAEHLGSQQAIFREWWAERQAVDCWGDQEALLPYLTPEQQADFKEYGGFVFEPQGGGEIFWHISCYTPFGCLAPRSPLTRVQWMIAGKLVWQAAAGEISLVVNKPGRTLP